MEFLFNFLTRVLSLLFPFSLQSTPYDTAFITYKKQELSNFNILFFLF